MEQDNYDSNETQFQEYPNPYAEIRIPVSSTPASYQSMADAHNTQNFRAAQTGLPTNDLYNKILMLLLPVYFVLTFLMVNELLSGIDFRTLQSMSLMNLTTTRFYEQLDGISTILHFAILFVLFMDIFQVRKGGGKILGLVLFGLLFRPGYFLWRSHVVKRGKKAAGIYTGFIAIMFVGYFIWVLSLSAQLVLQSMHP